MYMYCMSWSDLRSCRYPRNTDKKISSKFRSSKSNPNALKTCTRFELGRTAWKRARAHLLTPSGLGGRAFWSWNSWFYPKNRNAKYKGIPIEMYQESEVQINGFHLRDGVSPSPDGVRRRSRAYILAPVASSNRGHVFSAFGFGLVPLNFEGNFFLSKFRGYRHDLRSDHDIQW